MNFTFRSDNIRQPKLINRKDEARPQGEDISIRFEFVPLNNLGFREIDIKEDDVTYLKEQLEYFWTTSPITSEFSLRTLEHTLRCYQLKAGVEFITKIAEKQVKLC